MRYNSRKETSTHKEESRGNFTKKHSSDFKVKVALKSTKGLKTLNAHLFRVWGALRSHRDLETIVEAALHLTLATLLHMIGVQVRLNQRVIEQAIVFPVRDKRKASHIAEHRSIAILPVKPDQRAFLRKAVGCHIPANSGDPLAQFLPIAPVPQFPKLPIY